MCPIDIIVPYLHIIFGAATNISIQCILYTYIQYIYIYMCMSCVCVCDCEADWDILPCVVYMYPNYIESEGWGFESPSGRDIFCLKNFDTFTRTPVCVSKMNAVARAQLTFQMLTLLLKYIEQRSTCLLTENTKVRCLFVLSSPPKIRTVSPVICLRCRIMSTGWIKFKSNFNDKTKQNNENKNICVILYHIHHPIYRWSSLKASSEAGFSCKMTVTSLMMI